MLEKCEGFVGTLETVGASIGKSQEAYDTAMNQLKTGKGNLIRQAVMLKELGIKASGKKTVPLLKGLEEDLDDSDDLDDAED